MYATAQDMLLFYQARELAKTATPRNNPDLDPIDPVLLETLINQGDSSAWTEAQIARAEMGIVAINACLGDATREMDSYFIRRYTLPLSVDTIALNPLTRKCADIARFLLAERFFKDLEEVKERYNSVLTWLRDVGAGRAGLLIANVGSTGDVTVSNSFGAVITQGANAHDWSTY
jgi:phage gp36-like protein